MVSGDDFVQYLTTLAPEGDTLLLVRQKFVTVNGLRQTYLDGSPKYTYPAFLPNTTRRAGEAWYANTGSFILDRLQTRISASLANCQYSLALMLDDIGTKAPTPPLPPTWIIESSEGNYQWGYAYEVENQPTTGEQSALLNALAKAGFTDPGATNAVRNFRIPGSTNIKPGRGEFVSRMVEFHPERLFTWQQIAKAFDVTPDPASTSSYSSIKLTDTGSDSVLRWLNDSGFVLSSPNGEGWLAVVCPNKDAHTDGQIAARYKPVDRMFCCYHGHCADLNSEKYLRWVCDNGGPDVKPGLRDDMLAQTMSATLAKLRPTEAFPDEAPAIIADVEAKEERRGKARDTKAEWFDKYAYILKEDAYFDYRARREVGRTTFNALYRHIPCKSVHNDRKIEASVCYDENRDAMNAKIIDSVTYAAGENVFVNINGDIFGNRWRDARPDVSGVKAASISRWTDHCRKLVPEEAELNHIWDAMAFKLKNPRVKINHAVMHGGKGGSGKDTMWAPFFWSVCGPGMTNYGVLDRNNLDQQWGYALESEILVLNELKEPEAKERRALANKLKPLIAAPPEVIHINRKGLHPYPMLNRMFVVAFTNESVPLVLDSDDRRWFCVWSDATHMAEADAAAMWRWYREGGGFESITQWLYERDVSAFNPKARPMMTDFKASLVENSRSVSEGFLIEMMRAERGEFATGVVGSPFTNLADRLTQLAPQGTRIPQVAVLHALREAGWFDLGRIASASNPTKKQVWVSPRVMAENNSRSKLRDMVEETRRSAVLQHLQKVG